MKTSVLFTQQLIKRKKNKNRPDEMKQNWFPYAASTHPHQTPLFKTFSPLKHEIGNATAININNVSNTVQTVAT